MKAMEGYKRSHYRKRELDEPDNTIIPFSINSECSFFINKYDIVLTNLITQLLMKIQIAFKF